VLDISLSMSVTSFLSAQVVFVMSQPAVIGVTHHSASCIISRTLGMWCSSSLVYSNSISSCIVMIILDFLPEKNLSSFTIAVFIKSAPDPCTT
jgi:hypothetical protein